MKQVGGRSVCGVVSPASSSSIFYLIVVIASKFYSITVMMTTFPFFRGGDQRSIWSACTNNVRAFQSKTHRKLNQRITFVHHNLQLEMQKPAVTMAEFFFFLIRKSKYV